MKLFSIFRKDLRILARNRPDMAVLFLMPLAFILPISFALGAGDGYGIHRNNRMIPLPVVNYDGGPRAQDLMASVGESLRLEISFDSQSLGALGLSEEQACQMVFGTGAGSPAGQQPVPTQAPTQAAPSPTLTQEMPGYPPASEDGAGAEAATATDQGTGYPAVSSEDTGAETAAAPDQATGYPAAPTTQPTAAETGPAATTPAGAPAGGEGSLSTASSAACNEKAARTLLGRSARTAALIIPAGFSQAVDNGKQVQVTLLYDPAGDPTQFQQIEGIIRGSATKISLENQVARGLNQLDELIILAPDSVRQSWEQSAQPQAEEQDPALRLKKVSPSAYQSAGTPDTYQQTVPGYAVMYVFFIITAMAGSIREEKRTGTFRRLLSAPVSQGELAAGKLLATMLVGFVQVIFLFVVGAVVFRLSLGRDPLGFLVLTGALVTAAASLGLAVATTSLKGAGLAAPLVIAALLGGCMFPIDLMPPFLRSLSFAMPHSWALNGYLALMVRGQGLQEILPQIGVLLGFALVFFIIAVRRLRFED